MKRNIILSAVLVLLMCIPAIAQNDPREPGLYSVIGDDSTLLTTVRGGVDTKSTGFMGIEIEKKRIEYKGVTSDTVSYGTFVMVCDMNKKNIVQTMNKYDLFVKSMTPDNIIIVPLQVFKDKKRIYDEGKSVQGINTQQHERVEFSWEQISDNSYRIVCNPEPGEYAIVFREAKLGAFNFNTVFDFTVPEL